jgi:hypothetical protein
VLEVYSLQHMLVGSVEKERGSREVRQRQRLKRGRPGAGAEKAAKREDKLEHKGSR